MAGLVGGGGSALVEQGILVLLPRLHQALVHRVTDQLPVVVLVRELEVRAVLDFRVGFPVAVILLILTGKCHVLVVPMYE